MAYSSYPKAGLLTYLFDSLESLTRQVGLLICLILLLATHTRTFEWNSDLPDLALSANQPICYRYVGLITYMILSAFLLMLKISILFAGA